jgi:carboxypeptidase Taq
MYYDSLTRLHELCQFTCRVMPNIQNLEQTHPKFLQLKSLLAEIEDLYAAAAVLHWDWKTYMPPKGVEARGRQLATLNQIAHEKFTNGAIAQLLEDLKDYQQDSPYESDEASLIRLTRHHCEIETKVPTEFTTRFSDVQTECYQAWTIARSEDNFALVEPALIRMLEMSREYSSFFPDARHIADPHIAAYDYGMSAVSIRSVFSELRARLVPFVQSIISQPLVDNSCLHQYYPEAEQIAFCHSILRQMGYDMQRGRQDKTLHPFMTKFSIDDVRITTRFYENDLSQGLFSTIHEMGHAFYELGNAPELEGTPLAGGVSSGVHESQSRLWENLVGRSRPFWQYFYPQLQAHFPHQLGAISLETFYRAINRVSQSPIRTDADEITYNLHVMIRFDLELDLLEGKLAVKDLPAAWNARYQSDLGINPSSDSNGVLQDVHWYGGCIGGMFQGYTLGNLMSAQFFAAAISDRPNIPDAIETGNFTILRDWLQTHIYQHGRKFTAAETIERVTGEPISIQPLMSYFYDKYTKIYDV